MFLKKLTKTDYEILRIMVEDQNFSPKEIAEEIGVSDKTVRNRIKLMQENNVFKKKIVIDPNFFGYNFIIDFFLKIKKEDIKDVTEWLQKEHKHDISYLGRHWGNDNVSIQTLFKTPKEAEAFNKKLQNNVQIEKFDMTIVPLIWKDTYDWRPSQDNFRITKKEWQELDRRRKLKIITEEK